MHFPSLLRFPSAFAALAWLAVGVVGLGPIGWALVQPDPQGPAHLLHAYLAFVSPVLGGVIAVGGLGLLLALAHTLAWLDDRLAAALLRGGLTWSDARSVVTALVIVVATTLLGAMV